MEKLILRSIMYGADKIPDSWFEKVPGGYYKPGDSKAADSSKGSRGSSTNNKQTKGRDRRHSTGEAGRGQPPAAEMSRNHRSGGGERRRRRSERRRDHSSYDGIVDDEDLYSGDDRRRRRNHSSTRRPRSVDHDRDNYDSYGKPAYGERSAGTQPYPEHDFGPTPRNNYAKVTAAAALGATAGAAATRGALHSSDGIMSPMPFSPQPQRATAARPVTATGYVPYADIYGPATYSPQVQAFSPPPSSIQSGTQPSAETHRMVHPVAPPPEHYQQDAYAQDAPSAAAAGAGAAYGGQSAFFPSDYTSDNDHGYDNGLKKESKRDSYRRQDDSPELDGDEMRGDRRTSYHPSNEEARRSKSQGNYARNRYAPAGADVNAPLTGAPMMAVDPRKPLSAQWRGETTGAHSKQRRKDDRRPSRYGEDGAHAHRGSRRGNGYYSD